MMLTAFHNFIYAVLIKCMHVKCLILLIHWTCIDSVSLLPVIKKCIKIFDLRWQSQRQSFVVMLISVYLSIKYPGKSTNVFTAFYFMQMEAGMAKNRDRNGIKFLYIPHLTSCTSILGELGINLQDS